MNNDIYLFLDFDGVLIPGSFLYHSNPDIYGEEFEPNAKKLINKLIEKYKLKVIITSSWRIIRGLDRLKQMWKDRKMSGDIFGITPSLPTIRGTEIQSFIKKHNIKKYIIIDDDSDMLKNQKPFFIKCSWRNGFTEKEYKKAINILNMLKK